MVSTDDQEIAEVAKKAGANVPFVRSPANSGDFATTLDVIKEVIDAYKNTGRIFEEGCCIYACAPLINADLLEQSRRSFQAGAYDSLFPVVKYSHPIQRSLTMNKGRVTMNEPTNVNVRSQDLPLRYFDAGMFYWFNTGRIVSSKSLWTDNSGGFEIPELSCQDIDTESDWKLAELKFKLLNDAG